MKMFSRLLCVAALALPVAAQAGPLVWVGDANGNIATVDVTSGAATLIGNSGRVLTDIAFSPTGELYGITFTQLFKLDTATGAATLVGSTGNSQMNAMTFGSDGTLYAASTTGGLMTLNTTTGINTSLGGIGFGSAGDLTFVDDILYFSSNSGLVSIDLSVGAAGTLLGSFGLANVYGLSRGPDGIVYANSNQGIYSVDLLSGATSLVSSYTYPGATAAYGTTFRGESVDPVPGVPEPASWAMLIAGFGLCGAALRRRNPVAA